MLAEMSLGEIFMLAVACTVGLFAAAALIIFGLIQYHLKGRGFDKGRPCGRCFPSCNPNEDVSLPPH